MKTTLKASLVAIAVASTMGTAQSAGLGGISVFNALGQPVRADIQVHASKQELGSLSARIASPDAFRQANIPYSPLMTDIRVTVDTRGAQPVIHLSSSKPVNEPFLGVLLELEWGDGLLAREYTLLFDPVDMVRPLPPVAQVAPVTKTEPPATLIPLAPVAPEKEAEPAPVVAESEKISAEKQEPLTQDGHLLEQQYAVKQGDTLGKIASAHLPEGVTLEQMLIALHRENKSAFSRNNINRLKSGVILSIPSAEAAQEIDQKEAQKEIIAQAADFEAYRRRLAEQATGSAKPEEIASASQADSGHVVPKVDDASAAANSADRLKISRTVDGKQGATATGESQAEAHNKALEEELVARDKALAEANERVSELEKNIRDLQHLLELRNQALADLQKQGAQPEKPAIKEEPSQPVVTETPVETPPQAVAEEPAQEQQAAVEKPADEEVTSAEPPVPSQPEPVEALDTQEEEPAVEPEEESSSLPLILGGGAAVILAGGGLLYAIRRRRAKTTEDQELFSQFPDDSGGSMFGATGAQDVDTKQQSSGIATDFSKAGMSGLGADDGVDPVAEADVYIAYGRDAQAEEILLDALQTSPNRIPIYAKLLSIYAQRKSIKEFNALAAEFHTLTAGGGSEWEKAAELGRQLDPSNPLYVELKHDPFSASSMQNELSPATTTRVRGIDDIDLQSAAMGANAAASKETSAKPADETPRPASLSDLDFSTTVSGGVHSALALDKTDPLPQNTIGNTGDEDDETMSPHQLRETWMTPGEIGAFADIDQQETSLPALPLDFDLNLNTPADAEAKPEQQATALQKAVPAVDMALDSEDADLGGPPTELPKEVAAKPVSEEEEQKPADAESMAVSPPYEMSDSEVVDLEATNFQSPLEFEHHDDSAPSSALKGFTVKQEVDTKLELAHAYEDMGDIEGARELLNEVLNEGSPDQQAKAHEVLTRLGA